MDPKLGKQIFLGIILSSLVLLLCCSIVKLIGCIKDKDTPTTINVKPNLKEDSMECKNIP